MPVPPRAVHTVTVDFGRLLTMAEWSAVISQVRQIPYARTIRVDQVSWDRGTLEATTKKRTTTTR